MGCVLRRKLRNGEKGNFYVEFTDSQGKHHSQTLPEDRPQTRREAMKFLKEIQPVASERKFPQIFGKKIRFGDFATKYEDYCKVNNEKSTQKSKRGMIKTFKKFFKDIYIHNINRDSIDRYKGERLAQEINKSSINKEVRLLKAMFFWAISRDLFFGKNPVVGRDVKLREDEVDRRFLHEDELCRLYEVVYSDFCNYIQRAFILLGLNTGMRLGEVLNLKWGQVHLNENRIDVLKTKTKHNRSIPISQELKETLEVMPRNEEYVINNYGSKYKETRKMLGRILKKADIQDFTYHGFRHTFISHLVMEGVNLKAVQELAGHQSINQTMEYAHLAPDTKPVAIVTLGLRYQRIRKSGGKVRTGDNLPIIMGENNFAKNDLIFAKKETH